MICYDLSYILDFTATSCIAAKYEGRLSLSCRIRTLVEMKNLDACCGMVKAIAI